MKENLKIVAVEPIGISKEREEEMRNEEIKRKKEISIRKSVENYKKIM